MTGENCCTRSGCGHPRIAHHGSCVHGCGCYSFATAPDADMTHADLRPSAELPEDLTAGEYRRRARALVQQANDTDHGPRADRLMTAALVFATCARSAPESHDG